MYLGKKKENIGGRKTGREGREKEGGTRQTVGQGLPFSKNCHAKMNFFYLVLSAIIMTQQKTTTIPSPIWVSLKM